MICKPYDHFSVCSVKIKDAIANAPTYSDALPAANEWSSLYENLYLNSPSSTWTASDQNRLRAAMAALWDEYLGQYLDPASYALNLALLQYLPKLGPMLSLLTNPRLITFYGLLAPSPIANDFTQATPVNTEIQKLMHSKLPPMPMGTIKDRYPELFDNSFKQVTGSFPKP